MATNGCFTITQFLFDIASRRLVGNATAMVFYGHTFSGGVFFS
jgi:hypothetical protein